MNNEFSEQIPQFIRGNSQPNQYSQYQPVNSTYQAEPAPVHHYVSDFHTASPGMSNYQNGVNNNIKTSIVQSTYHPISSPLSFNDKVNSSVYQEHSNNKVTFHHNTTNQPVTFSTVRPVDSSSGFNINTTTTFKQPQQPSSFQPSSSSAYNP